MKIMKISVEPEIFLSLSGCSVEKAPNRHFTASLSGYVSEEEEKKMELKRSVFSGFWKTLPRLCFSKE